MKDTRTGSRTESAEPQSGMDTLRRKPSDGNLGDTITQGIEHRRNINPENHQKLANNRTLFQYGEIRQRRENEINQRYEEAMTLTQHDSPNRLRGTENLIDKAYAAANGIPTLRKALPRRVLTVDGQRGCRRACDPRCPVA